MNNIKMNNMELQVILGLSTVFSLRMLGIFMILPVLSIYGMALQDASEALIGLAIGIYWLVQVIFQIPVGLLSDYIGRKSVIIGGLLLFALGSAIAALSDSIWGIIFGRILQGSGTITPAVMGLLSDLIHEQNRTKAMAFIGISFGITFTIAMVIGPIIAHVIGLSGLFWCTTALAVAGVMLTLLVIPTTNTNMLNQKFTIVDSNCNRIITNPQLLKLSMGIFCLHAILMSTFIALPPMMVQSGFLPGTQWKVYMVTMLISFIAVVPIIIYAEVKRQMRRVFIGCVTLLVIAEFVLLIANSHFWIMFAGMQMFFLAFNIMEAILPSLMSKESPKDYRGAAMGFYSTSQFIGGAVGGMFGGFLFQLAGGWSVFLADAIISLVWWLVSITLRDPPYVTSMHITLTDHIEADGS